MRTRGSRQAGNEPDEVAAWESRTTQQIAERLFRNGWAGLRWWSAFFGTGTALFCSWIAWRKARYPTAGRSLSALRGMLSRKPRGCSGFSLHDLMLFSM